MDRSSKIVVFCLVALLASAALAGEGEGIQMPKPTEEHALLGQWVGEWVGKGEVKPGPFGEGGPMTWTETCQWFGGTEFSVVCKSEGDGPWGPTKGLGIMSYNAEKKVFTHYGVDSTGWSGYAEGTRDGKTWTFESAETMGGQSFKSRFTLTLETATRMVFSWSVSMDGESYMVMMDGATEKKK